MGKFGWSYPPGAAGDPNAPWNQEFDDTHCVYCGADLPDDVTGLSVADEGAVMDGFCKLAHEQDYEKHGPREDWGKPQWTAEQEDRRKALHNAIYEWQRDHVPEPGKLSDLNDFLPEDDFNWDEHEPGDWHVHACGEKDCDQQWHLSAYWLKYKRVAGYLTIESWSCDMDGDKECDCAWDESTGEPFDESGIDYDLGSEPINNFFRGWAEYWIDAAINFNDPCDQLIRPIAPADWIDFCLNAAANNVKYLTKEEL